MSKSNQRLITVNLNVGNVKLAVEIALRSSIEYDKVVYLPNAYSLVAEKVSPIEWRSALSQLAKDGKYRAMSGEFGGAYGELI